MSKQLHNHRLIFVVPRDENLQLLFSTTENISHVFQNWAQLIQYVIKYTVEAANVVKYFFIPDTTRNRCTLNEKTILGLLFMFLPKIDISIKAVFGGHSLKTQNIVLHACKMAGNSNGTSLPTQTQKADCLKTDTEVSSECTDEIGSGIKTLCQSL